MPTSSALNQQRQKLKPAALEAVFKHFNSSATALLPNILSDTNTAFWLPMVRPALISVHPLSHQLTIIAHPEIPSEESTACI